MRQRPRAGWPEARPVELPGAGGVALRGDAWGPPEGRPVVLLHGGGQTRHSWAAAGRHIGAQGWLGVALDLRGHGESDWAGEGRYLPDHFVADLRAVARVLGRPPIVVGASLGGMTGLLAEGESEGGVLAGLVLVDVTPRIEPEGVSRIIEFMLARPEGFASLEEAAEAVAAYRRHRAPPRDLAGLRKNLRRAEDGRWHWHWDPAFIGRDRVGDAEELKRLALSGLGEGGAAPGPRFNDADRLLAAARRLRIPTLLVRGRESDVVSEQGVEEFLAAVPHARYADVSEAGHMVAGDRNDAFNAAVLGFLRDLAS
jgi:pimeloyl-ACP methyl ester carboxylesterase